MKIQGVQNTQTFKSVYVTTSTKNNGNYVEKEVINPFQPIARQIAEKYGELFKDIAKITDVYVLAAGEGTRFRPLSHEQGKIVNKISFGIPLVNEDGTPAHKNIHMLDFPMAMASPFIDERGLIRKNAETAKGSFAEVVDNAQKLREAKKPQKNVIVMCGDNLFDTDKNRPFELLEFSKAVINNPDKMMGLIGVEREPEDVVNKFGVLNIIPTEKDDIVKLAGFVEKPKTEESARKFATPSNKCIANTGMFVIKAEAMEWLMDRLEEDPMFIAKDADEPYDFAAACTKVQEKYGANKCDVKLVQTWEDAGEPKALYRTIDQFAKGRFLTCLPEELQKAVMRSMPVIYDGKTMLASPESIEKFGSAKNLTAKINELTGRDTKLGKVDGTFISTSSINIIG